MKLNCNKLLVCAGGSVTLHMFVMKRQKIAVKEEREKLKIHSNFRLENLKKRDSLETLGLGWRVM
jgi:hypothetical protein